jgi:porin
MPRNFPTRSPRLAQQVSKTLRACAALIGATFLGSAAMAADPADIQSAPTALSLDYSGDFLTRPALTGDWGGMRNELAKKGLTVDLYSTQVYQGVLTGGRDKGWNYGGRENISINLDTQKMGLWPGGFLFIEAEGNYGEFVAAPQTGAILPTDANQLFPSPDSPNFNLPAFHYTQFLSKQFGVVLGKFDTVTTGDLNEFAHGKGDKGFLNTAFSFDPVAVPVVPYSALGAGLVFLPTSDPNEFIITMSMLDSEGTPGDCGFDTAFEGGTSYVATGRYTTHFFNLTGHQFLGGGYSDRLYTDLDQHLRNFIIPDLPIQKASGSWFVNYNFDQYIYQPDPTVSRGVGIFGRFGGSDGDANPIHVFYSGGIAGKGIIPGRENDQFGIGCYYIQTANAKIPERLNFSDSYGLEAFYEIAITKWMYLTPDLQYVQPSQNNVDSSFIFGVRWNLTF